MDFEWILFEFKGGINAKHCKIKNLDKFKGYYTENSFDDFVISEYDYLFLEDNFTNEFKEKYYRRTLEIEDILNLNEENLKALLNKNYLNNMSINGSNYFIKCVIKEISLEKCINIYKYDKELFNSIVLFIDYISGYYKEIINICLIEELNILKNEYYNLLYTLFSREDINFNDVNEIFTSEFKKLHKNIFSLPKNVLEELFINELSFRNAFKYVDILTDFDLANKISSSKENSVTLVNSLNNLFVFLKVDKNISLQDLMKKYPKYFEYILDKNIEFSSSILSSLINKVNYMINNNINVNIYELFCEEVVYDSVLRKGFMLSVSNGKIDLPEWIKEMGYIYFHSIESYNDLINLPKNAIVLDRQQNKLFYYFGIDNIQKLEEEIHIFENNFDEYFELLLDFASKFPTNNTSNHDKYIKFIGYDNFREFFSKILTIFKRKGVFKEVSNYDFIEGKFRSDFPEIFIDEDAPLELKNYFYTNQVFLSYLVKHPEYKKYIIGKDYGSTLGIDASSDELNLYFNVFGFDEGIKLLKSQENVVLKLIRERNSATLFLWYQKTKNRFVPSEVVMRVFPINESEKFIRNRKLWQKLVSVEGFLESDEAKDGLLKLSYALGVFEGDVKSTEKLYRLINLIPETISENEFLEYDRWINQQISFMSSSVCHLVNDIAILLESKNIFLEKNSGFIGQLYKKNENGEYKIIFNMLEMLDVNYKIKELMNKCLNNMITPEKIHNLFSGFTFNYDVDFVKLFYKNAYEIFYTKKGEHIVNIQNRFKEIKTINSARKITLDLAIKCVLTNVFKGVDVGNNTLASFCSIAGYSQDKFERVQDIFNYSKTRIVSSIPKIKGIFKDYTYEILNLNDPLAIVIGTLTNCCQEVFNVAQTCMEHSMLSTNGRVFVIKDKSGKIIAQSWVWRNKEVLCFDNIEVPTKILKEDESILEDVFNIYNKASLELVKIDKLIYDSTNNKGYLKLVSVGIGYNDISNILTNKLEKCVSIKPRLYKSIFDNESLYVNDSITQYAFYSDKHSMLGLEELNLYKDDYIIKNKYTFNEEDYNIWESFKVYVDKENSSNYEKDYYTLMDFYDLSDDFNIVIDPSFVLVFQYRDNKVKLIDLIFKDKVLVKDSEIDLSDSIIFKLNVCLSQIGNDFDISLLTGYKLDMINLCIEKEKTLKK